MPKFYTSMLFLFISPPDVRSKLVTLLQTCLTARGKITGVELKTSRAAGGFCFGSRWRWRIENGEQCEVRCGLSLRIEVIVEVAVWVSGPVRVDGE